MPSNERSKGNKTISGKIQPKLVRGLSGWSFFTRPFELYGRTLANRQHWSVRVCVCVGDSQTLYFHFGDAQLLYYIVRFSKTSTQFIAFSYRFGKKFSKYRKLFFSLLGSKDKWSAKLYYLTFYPPNQREMLAAEKNKTNTTQYTHL